MQVTTQAAVSIPAELGPVFALATDLPNFHRYFKGSGPIPAVRRVEWLPGAKPVPGARRNVHNSDGSIVVEELLELTPDRRHHYRLISGFKPPFSWMVEYAEGDWHFSREGGQTHVDWHYAFKLRSPLALPIVFPIVRVFFHRAMQDCLLAMRDALLQPR